MRLKDFALRLNSILFETNSIMTTALCRFRDEVFQAAGLGSEAAIYPQSTREAKPTPDVEHCDGCSGKVVVSRAEEGWADDTEKCPGVPKAASQGPELQLFSVVDKKTRKVRRKFLVEGTLEDAVGKFNCVVAEEQRDGEPIVWEGDEVCSEPIEYTRGLCEV